MRTRSAHRARPLRRLAGLGLIALAMCALAMSPALAGASGHAAKRGQGKTVALHFYSVTQSFTYHKADGTAVQPPPQNAGVGDQFEITEVGYTGNHAKHSKKPTTSAYTICVFKTAKAAPTCEGVAALGGNQLVTFHTASGGDPVVTGGTGRYAGATGGATLTQIGDTNNSDLVITLKLR